MTKEEKQQYWKDLGPCFAELAVALPYSVVDPQMWHDLWEGIKEVGRCLGMLIFRLFWVCIYPVSLLVMTPVYAAAKCVNRRAEKRAQQDFIDSYNHL